MNEIDFQVLMYCSKFRNETSNISVDIPGLGCESVRRSLLNLQDKGYVIYKEAKKYINGPLYAEYIQITEIGLNKLQ